MSVPTIWTAPTPACAEAARLPAGPARFPPGRGKVCAFGVRAQTAAQDPAQEKQDPAQEKTFDVPPGICYNNQAHPAGPQRPAGNIWSITQEVEEVALERA